MYNPVNRQTLQDGNLDTFWRSYTGDRVTVDDYSDSEFGLTFDLAYFRHLKQIRIGKPIQLITFQL